MEKEELAQVAQKLLKLWIQISQKFEEEGHRDSLEIKAQILIVAVRGRRKTHIVYKANLSSGSISAHLKELKEAGLIEYNSEKKLFKTTIKGIRFLENFSDSINVMMGHKGAEIKLTDEAALQILLSII